MEVMNKAIPHHTLYRFIAKSVNGGRPVGGYHLAVLLCSVALVAMEPVEGEKLVEFLHNQIPAYLRRDGCRRDGKGYRIPALYRYDGNAHIKLEIAVEKNNIGSW